MELQEVVDRQSREQSQMKERLAALSSHVAELEEDLDTARKDLIKSEETNSRLQRDVREVSAPGVRVALGLGVWGVWCDCFAHWARNSRTARRCETDRRLPFWGPSVLSPRSGEVETWSCWPLAHLPAVLLRARGMPWSVGPGFCKVRLSEFRPHHAQTS